MDDLSKKISRIGIALDVYIYNTLFYKLKSFLGSVKRNQDLIAIFACRDPRLIQRFKCAESHVVILTDNDLSDTVLSIRATSV